ncbi:MAG: hypothetical protein LBE82_13070, partial [Chitinophagaceae bacterium]|nr:hypothetical protein [Chitinophagaceae bacterium]
MKKILLALLFVPFIAHAQSSMDWAKLKRQSAATFAYKISAVDAKNYLQKDSIPIDRFLPEQPAYIFPDNKYDEDTLQKGHYVLLRLNNDEVNAEIISCTDLLVYPNANENIFLLEIRKKTGEPVQNATVIVNGKPARYLPASQNYRLKQTKLPEDEDAFTEIYAAEDSTFVTVSAKEPYPSVLKQRWTNFKITRFGRIITYVPNKILSLFNRRYRSYYSKTRLRTSGYILFNQPKYKFNDTLKFKGYAAGKKGKLYKQPVNVFLEYYDKGKNVSTLLTTLKPTAGGSFIYQFVVGDTLISDMQYFIIFKQLKTDKEVVRGKFKIEQYVLDNILNYSVRSDKEKYFTGDSVILYASATDANKLPLLDTKVNLTLTTENIFDFDKDSIYVKDTLFTEEKPLASAGDTKFVIPEKYLPKAETDIKATVEFIDANNEIQEKSTTISYNNIAKQLSVWISADTVYAEYKQGGKSVPANGEFDIDGMRDLKRTQKISFPCKIKIDPLAKSYDFYVYDENGSIITSEDIDIDSRENRSYQLSFMRVSKVDTIGFDINNPYKIPVSFIVLDGTKIIATGKSDAANIAWRMAIRNINKIYQVEWQYVWAGEQQKQSDRIAVLYKLLNINVSTSQQVFPGQKDSLTVLVKDYKNAPVKNVNLAAVSFNTQFSKDIKQPILPYTAIYRGRNNILRGRMSKNDMDYPYTKFSYPLGKHSDWVKKFSADTLPFYQMLFPKSGVTDIPTLISEIIPQVAVHVEKSGIPQSVYLLYLNKNLVYAADVTDTSAYSFPVVGTYLQVGVRLKETYFEIDSIYIQPGYKHDIFIDADRLPEKAITKKMPDEYTPQERNLIENSFWQLDNNAQTNYGYVWQN